MAENDEDPEAVRSGNRVDDAGVVEPPAKDITAADLVRKAMQSRRPAWNYPPARGHHCPECRRELVYFRPKAPTLLWCYHCEEVYQPPKRAKKAA